MHDSDAFAFDRLPRSTAARKLVELVRARLGADDRASVFLYEAESCDWRP